MTRDPIEEAGTPPPPCERHFIPGRTYEHPRFPSGDCIVCGALCTEGCKHPDYAGWEYEQTGEWPRDEQ